MQGLLKWLAVVRIGATHGDKVIPHALAEFGEGLNRKGTK